MMKKLVLLIAVLALAGATTVAMARDSANTTVSITAAGFRPDHVIVKPGDTVTWRNDDTAKHQVVSDTGDFRSPVLAPKQSYSFRFAEEASYSYHDGMKPGPSGVVDAIESHVTIGLTRLRVPYTSPVRIFGSIPTGASGEQVTLTFRPYRGTTQTRTATTTDGAYELTYRPRIRTEVTASWNGAESTRAPVIGVRPLVTFRSLNAKQLFFVRVKAQRSYAHNVVRIQRLNRSGAWVTTKKVRLNRFSQAQFVANFPRGTTRARAWVIAVPGYTAGASKTKTIRR
jgi:plastocyanin